MDNSFILIATAAVIFGMGWTFGYMYRDAEYKEGNYRG